MQSATVRNWAIATACAMLGVFSPGVASADQPRTPYPVMNVPNAPLEGFSALTAPGFDRNRASNFYGWTVEQLFNELVRGAGASDMKLDGKGRFFIVTNGANRDTVPPEQPAVDRPGTFQLHSNPGASKTIRLNFLGTNITGTRWQGVARAPDSGILAKFSMDGQHDALSAAEHQAIEAIWRHVAEDFAPFDVNVTTDTVSDAMLQRANAADKQYGTTVHIYTRRELTRCTCPGSWVYVNSFADLDHTVKPILINSSTSSDGSDNVASVSSSVSSAVSRALGHALGLRRDIEQRDRSLGPGFRPVGTSTWSPIMGAGTGVTQFSKGGPRAINPEDDFEVIERNGLPLRGDDHGNNRFTADALPGADFMNSPLQGVIERQDDIDTFLLHASPGPLDARVTRPATGSNLSLRLALFDSNGRQLTRGTRTGNVENLTHTITAAGTYYLSVQAIGRGEAASGNSTYGSRGTYTLGARFTANPSQPPAADFTVSVQDAPLTGSALTVMEDQPVQFKASGSTGANLQYRWHLGTRQQAGFSPVSQESQTYAEPGIYTVGLSVRNSNGLVSSKWKTLIVASNGSQPPPPSEEVPHGEHSHVAVLVSKAGTGGFTVNFSTNMPDSRQNRRAVWEWSDARATSFRDYVPIGPTSTSTASKGAITHTFPGPGLYLVGVSMTDTTDYFYHGYRTILLDADGTLNTNPSAYFTRQPIQPGPPEHIRFDASGSEVGTDGGSYQWSWGDGTVTVSTNSIVSHMFPGPGTYTVGLTVRNSHGLSYNSTEPVTVPGSVHRELVVSQPFFTTHAAADGASLKFVASATVRDHSGKAVSGASVTWAVEGRDITRTVTSDSTGLVEFPFDIAGNSAPGSCVTAKVTQASKANHVFNSIESQLPSVTSCDLRAAFTARKLYLTTPRITVTEDAEGVPPKMKATFTVRDQAGRTVQGATVNASWSGLAAGAAGPVSVTATTNNSGVAAFETAAPSAVPGCFILTTQLPAASSVVGCTSGGTTPALPQPGISFSSGSNRPADVSFTAADNRPGTPGSQIVAYFWTWGDGTVSVTDRPGITHSYPATGTYNVRLVMKDSLGRVGTATAEVVVRDTPAGNRLSFGQVQVDRLSWYTPVPFALGIARVLVVDQTGAPVEDASVTVSWPPGNETETKTTDSNGEAVFWSEVSGSCVQVMMKEATKAGYASAPASDQPHKSPGCATPPASTASAGAPAADAN